MDSRLTKVVGYGISKSVLCDARPFSSTSAERCSLVTEGRGRFLVLVSTSAPPQRM